MTPFHFGEPPAAADQRRIEVPAKTETKEHLLKFLKDAFPLPAYFGHNWDALEESLCDLEWLSKHKAALIHADVPLKTPAERRTYLEILAKAAKGSQLLQIIFPTQCRAEIEAILSATQ